MTAPGARRLDVCVVGHITYDSLVVPGRAARRQPGGSAYYAGATLAALGRTTIVVTRLAPTDEAALTADLARLGAEVRVRPSRATTRFENVYEDVSLTCRRQRLGARAGPFAATDLSDLDPRAFLLGPMTPGDITSQVVAAAAESGAHVALDVQGLVRRLAGQVVRPAAAPEAAGYLARVGLVKADLDEAKLLTGRSDPEEAGRALADMGPDEALITVADRGSVVCRGGRVWRIPAFPAERTVDATGCGDSYLAAYLHCRLAGDDPGTAGRFAAALASLKLECRGPYVGPVEAVRARAGLAR